MPEGFSWAALKSSKSPRTNDPFRVPQMLFQRRAAWGVARVNLWHKKLEIRWIRSSWSAAQRSSASPPATHCASVLISRCSVQVQVCSVATKNLHARRIPTIDCLTQGAIYIVYCCRCQVANHCGLLVAACLMSLWLSLKPTTCPDPESTRACFLQLVFQYWSLDFLSLLTNSDFTLRQKLLRVKIVKLWFSFQRSLDCPFCTALPVRECVCVCVCVRGCMCVCTRRSRGLVCL